MGRGGAVRAVRDGSYEPREAPSAEPDPSEADLLEELGDRICRMAAHIHAATAHFLELVAEFDRCGGWKAGGHRSCAHWLVVRTGYTLRTARGYVRVARALEELPRIGEAMARGRLSFCQVRALTRVATPETEEDLLELAEGCTVSTLERRLRAWRQGGRNDEDDDGDAPISGTRAERYQMFVHVDADTLSEEGQPGRSEFEDGTRLAADTARRLACDAATVHVNRASVEREPRAHRPHSSL